jgi:DNA-binding NarL/FixJ family response regulator
MTDDSQLHVNGHRVVDDVDSHGVRLRGAPPGSDDHGSPSGAARNTPRGSGEEGAVRTILIIDNHTLFSATLEMVLAGTGFVAKQLTPVGGVPQILEQVGALAPGLVLLDLQFGYTDEGRRIDGVELIAPIRARGAAVLAVTDNDPLHRVAAAVAAGAEGVVSKFGSLTTMLDTVIRVTAGEAVMSVTVRQDLLALHHDHHLRQQRITQRLHRLSPREREVLALLCRGHRIAAIAARFVVSQNTVRSQVRGILVKLDVNSQLEAAALVRGQPVARHILAADEAPEHQRRCFRCGKLDSHHWPWCPQYGRKQYCEAVVGRGGVCT